MRIVASSAVSPSPKRICRTSDSGSYVNYTHLHEQTIPSTQQLLAFGVAVDATSVYWTSEFNRTVMKVPLDGGVPMVLASGQLSPAGIAVDATSVTWVNEDGGTVMRLTP